MKIRKIISAILTMSVMSACIIPIAKADGLYSEKFDMTKVKADKTDGVTKEVEVPDGDNRRKNRNKCEYLYKRR